MKKIISISLDEELVRRINEMCKISERSKSWFIKKAIDSYLENFEDIIYKINGFQKNKSALSLKNN